MRNLRLKINDIFEKLEIKIMFKGKRVLQEIRWGLPRPARSRPLRGDVAILPAHIECRPRSDADSRHRGMVLLHRFRL